MQRLFTLAVSVCATMLLAGCIHNFVRNNDDRYMQPGALDSPVATNFDEYHYKFLDRYRIIHAWPVTSACKYRSMSTKYRMGETSYGDVEIVRDIYEADGHTWQRFEPEFGPANIDNFVRPTYTIQMSERDPISGIKTGRMVDVEQKGFDTLCFEAWVRTSHSLVLRLYKSPLAERKVYYSKKPGKHFQETVNANTWWVWRYPVDDGSPKSYGGEAWVRPIGDTGYTLAFELGAGPESLKGPETHAKFQAMFRHLLESVKIEPLTPAIEAEIAELKTKANAIQAEDCKKSKNPPSWCARNIIR